MPYVSSCSDGSLVFVRMYATVSISCKSCFFFLFTVSGMSIIPIKNLLEENHGGKADYFVHTVVHMHRNKHDKHMDSIHLPPPVRGEGQVSPQAKGLYLATCMSKDKNMHRGHQGWNVPVVPVVSSPLVGDDMQHLGN